MTDAPAPALRAPGPREGFDRGRLAAQATDAAPALLGALLTVVEDDGSETISRVVEVEAYHESDPASHCHGGRTPRTEPMFDRPGTAYVYRSYGIHWCLNVACEPAGTGAAVLVRAAVGLSNHDVLHRRRGREVADAGLLRGPGVLTRTLGLDGGHDGTDLCDPAGAVRLETDGWRPDPEEVRRGPRVGVRRAPDVPWRFRLAQLPEVSRYRRHPRADEQDEPQ